MRSALIWIFALLTCLGLAQLPPSLTRGQADLRYAGRYPASPADLAAPVPPTASVQSDAFVGTAGTTLTAHALDTGGAWARSPSSYSGVNLALDGAGGVRLDGAGGYAVYLGPAQSSTDYQVTAQVRFLDSGAASTETWIGARAVDGGNYYAAHYSGASGRWEIVRWYKGGSSTLTYWQDSISTYPTTRAITLAVSGSSILLYVDGTLRAQANDFILGLAGSPVLAIYDGTVATNTTRGHIGPVTVGSTLRTGAVYQTAAGYGAASLATTGASGGTGYTYQWYRSASKGALGTAIAGATSPTLADAGLTPSTRYYYTLAVTSGGVTVYSQQVIASTLRLPIGGLGVIGDSKTAGYGTTNAATKAPIAVAATRIASTYGVASIPWSNQGVSGTTTGDWATSSNGTTTNGANLVTACDTMLAAGCTHVLVCLGGVNDSKAAAQSSLSTYKTNLQTVLSYVAGRGLVCVVCCEGVIVPEAYGAVGLWDATSVAALEGYYRALPGLVNGTTILLGDLDYRAWSARNSRGLADGIHEDDPSSAAWGEFQAAAVLRVLGGLRP